VRVRAKDGRHSPDEIPAHRVLLTGDLAMEIDDPERRQWLRGAVEQAVHGGKRRIELIHEDATHDIYDRNPVTIGQGVQQPALARGVIGIVERAQHRPAAVEIVVDLALVPDVVAAGDHVHAVGEQLLGEAGGQAGAGRQVLAVGDDEVEIELCAQLTEAADDRQPPRLADDVADDHAPQERGAVRHRA
jgi:hypothetical protein